MFCFRRDNLQVVRFSLLPSSSKSILPERLCSKDFASFKICGEGRFPKTFLLKGQVAKGVPL